MYAKLFGSVLDSSLWAESYPVRILFMTMLAMCDREGYIFASDTGLFYRARMPKEDGQKALEVLLSPDPDSADQLRNPENEGRRVERVPGGFRILNYTYYRDLRDEDERREQDRERQAQHRKKVKEDEEKSRSVTVGHTPNVTVTEKRDSHKEGVTVTDGHASSRSVTPSAKLSLEVSSEANTPLPKRGGPKIRPGPPTLEEVRQYHKEIGAQRTDPDEFFFYWGGQGWKRANGAPIVNWKLTYQQRERSLELADTRDYRKKLPTEVLVGRGRPEDNIPSDNIGGLKYEADDERQLANHLLRQKKPIDEVKDAVLKLRETGEWGKYKRPTK